MTVTPSDWTMDHGPAGTYPFVEDENCNITGLGHQDPAEFAAAINRYDICVGGMEHDEVAEWDWTSSIAHRYAVLADDGEHLLTKIDDEPVTADTPGAIAITTLWGQR